MSQRVFAMRLQCRYTHPDNAVLDLSVEHQLDGLWRPLDLQVRTPGFDVFVYSVLACQHTYFRLNCAESGLLLRSARGQITLETDADWRLETLDVDFTGVLESGTPTATDTDHIVERMGLCPVSRNIKPAPHERIQVQFRER